MQVRLWGEGSKPFRFTRMLSRIHLQYQTN